MTSAWILVGLGAVLTLGTAVFVAAEFSLVALDPSRVDESTRHGRRVAKAHRRLSTQLSGAQVGITVTTILLGYTTQPAVTSLLRVPLDNSALSRAAVGTVAGVLSLILVNVFSMIVGELVPKNLALSEPARMARLTAPLNMAFTAGLRPLITLLNGAAVAILRVFGVESKEELVAGRSAQELAALVRRSAEAGTLAPSTALLLKNSLDFAALTALDVMTDRTRMTVLAVDATAADVVTTARASGHSRFPVIEGSHDDIVGLVHLRAAVAVPIDERAERSVRDLMMVAPRIPETVSAGPLLEELRGFGHQMAIVVDEYGGTAGLVTLEDVIEELVGEVADEHDRRHIDVHRAPDGGWSVPALLRPDEVFEVTGLAIPDDPAYETVGGYVMAKLGRLAVVGDEVGDDAGRDDGVGVGGAGVGGVGIGKVRVRVERIDGRRVERVRVWAEGES
jgi:CBS domain containing-hemolysin-like protein